MFDVWSSYAQAAFGKYPPIFAGPHRGLPSIVDGDLADVLIKAKNTISEIKLQLDKSGLPILPDPLPTSRPDLDSTVRQFVTGYYRECFHCRASGSILTDCRNQVLPLANQKSRCHGRLSLRAKMTSSIRM